MPCVQHSAQVVVQPKYPNSSDSWQFPNDIMDPSIFHPCFHPSVYITNSPGTTSISCLVTLSSLSPCMQPAPLDHNMRRLSISCTSMGHLTPASSFLKQRKGPANSSPLQNLVHGLEESKKAVCRFSMKNTQEGNFRRECRNRVVSLSIRPVSFALY